MSASVYARVHVCAHACVHAHTCSLISDKNTGLLQTGKQCAQRTDGREEDRHWREGSCSCGPWKGRYMTGRVQTWQNLVVHGNDFELKPKNSGTH